MNGADIIREVSLDLNDQEPGYEYTRWPVAQLQSYLREALLHVGKRMQDWFVERVVLEVQPGADWQKGCQCDEIIRIVGESTKDGRLIRSLRRLEDDEANTWPSNPFRCQRTGKAYVMESYSINAVDDSLFRVFPPVAYGDVKYVIAECYVEPTGDLTKTVNSEAVAIVKQWMLYRALSIDSENNPNILALAKQHQQTFFDLLNLAIQTDMIEKAKDGSLRSVQNKTSK